MLKSSINTNGGYKYIRTQIKRARVEANDSQADLAMSMGKSRVTISDMERGRVIINANDLLTIALTYNKPISYFFPPEFAINQDELAPIEEELLFLFKKLPHVQQHIAIEQMKEQVDFISNYLENLKSEVIENN